MKVSLSKRLLSAFLAMLMIITSVPMMTLTAFAAEDKAEVLSMISAAVTPLHMTTTIRAE